jgi:hypothetical protein
MRGAPSLLLGLYSFSALPGGTPSRDILFHGCGSLDWHCAWFWALVSRHNHLLTCVWVGPPFVDVATVLELEGGLSSLGPGCTRLRSMPAVHDTPADKKQAKCPDLAKRAEL